MAITNSALSRAYNAGNFDSAYISEDLETAIQQDEHNPTGDARKAYVLGFFACYEPNEIPYDYFEEWYEAACEIGHRLQAIGIAWECCSPDFEGECYVCGKGIE